MKTYKLKVIHNRILSHLFALSVGQRQILPAKIIVAAERSSELKFSRIRTQHFVQVLSGCQTEQAKLVKFIPTKTSKQKERNTCLVVRVLTLPLCDVSSCLLDLFISSLKHITDTTLCVHLLISVLVMLLSGFLFYLKF